MSDSRRIFRLRALSGGIFDAGALPPARHGASQAEQTMHVRDPEAQTAVLSGPASVVRDPAFPVSHESSLQNKATLRSVMPALIIACVGLGSLAPMRALALQQEQCTVNPSTGERKCEPVGSPEPQLPPKLLDRIEVTAPRLWDPRELLNRWTYDSLQNRQTGPSLPTSQKEGASISSSSSQNNKNPCPESEVSPKPIGNPIIPSNGNKIESEIDFQTAGEVPLYLKRTYSRNRPDKGLFGYYWISNFDLRIAKSPDGNTVSAYRNDGSRIDYSYKTAPAAGWYETGMGANSRVIGDGSGGYVVYMRDHTVETYDSGGRITTQKNPRGVGITFTYAGTKLQKVQHTSGRSVQFAWTGDDLTAVTDPAGNVFTYGYFVAQANPRFVYLNSVVQPGTPSTTTTYHYELPLRSELTGKSYNGVRYSTFGYDTYGRALSSEHGSGADKNTFTYTFGSNGALTTVHTNPLGKKTIYQFLDGKMQSVTGNASANCALSFKDATYDSNGYPDSVSDFKENLTDYDYDPTGQVMRKVEAAGTPEARETKYTWGSDGRIEREVVTGYRQTDYAYRVDGLLSSVIVKNLSDKGVANQVLATTYTYATYANGMLKSVTIDGPLSGNQDTQTTEFDAFGNWSAVKNSLGHATTYSAYNALGLPGRIIGPNGAMTDYTYDARGKVLAEKRYVGGTAYTTSNVYDNRGRLVTNTTPDGVVTSFSYDNNNRLIRTSRAEPDFPYATQAASGSAGGGSTSAVAVEKSPVKHAPNGVCADCGGGDPGNPGGPGGPTPVDNATFVSQSIPATMNSGRTYALNVRMTNNGTTTWTASSGYRLGLLAPTNWGIPSRIELANSIPPGQTASFDVSVIAPAAGNYAFQWQMVHDGVGWFGSKSPSVTVEVQPPPPAPIGFQKYSYNLNGDVTVVETGVERMIDSSITAGGGGMAATASNQPNACHPYPDCYEPPGPGNPNPSWETLVLGRTFVDYDELGRVLARRGNQGQNMRYTYDGNGNVESMVDSSSRRTGMTYDGLDRLVTTTDARNGVTRFGYDAGDSLVKATDPRGLITAYAYDGLGQLWSQTSPDTGTTSFQYNAYGQRTAMIRADGSRLGYDYQDALGRLTYAGSPSEGRFFSYDTCASGKGRLCDASSTVPAAVITTVSFAYTPEGQLAARRERGLNADLSTAYQYDGMGRVIGMSYPSGVSVGYSYRYGRLTGMTTTAGGVTTNVVSNATYQPFGAVTSWTYGNGLNRGYNYDLDGRLTGISAVNGGNLQQSLTYGYDANNQITALTNGLDASGSHAYQYDELGRLTRDTIGGGAQVNADTFDAVGNRATRSVTQGSASSMTNYPVAADSNRIQNMNGPVQRNFVYTPQGNLLSSNGWQGNRSYTYDAFDRLKSVSVDGVASTYTVNAFDQRVLKTKGGVDTRYVFAGQNTLIAHTTAAGAWRSYLWFGDQLVAVVRPDNVLLYVHNDHLGRPEIATNALAQQVWKSVNASYHSVGNTPGVIIVGFPGQIWDEDTSTWYNGFRDYDPNLGRYLQSDPIGLAGGLNTYAYVRGNPISLIDPLGLVDRNYSAPWDGANKGLELIPSPSGMLTVGVHFNGTNFIGPNGQAWTPQQLADQIKADTDLSKYDSVRLYSCRAGAEGSDGAAPAQAVANALGMVVQAPTLYTWVVDNPAAPYQGNYGKTPSGGIDRSNPGAWPNFRPVGP